MCRALHIRGEYNLCDLSDLVQVLVVDGDSDAARFDAYQGARPRRRGMLNESGSSVRVEDAVDLFRKDWVQSVRARLNWLYSWGNVNPEGAQGAFSTVFGREDICEVCESQRKCVDSGGISTRGIQHEAYASDVWGNSVLQVKE